MKSIKRIAALSALVFTAALALTGTAAATGESVDSYADCPNGRVCIWTGWNGSGSGTYVPGCGGWNIPAGFWKNVESVRTYGNAVRLYTGLGEPYDSYVGPWTSTNLAPEEANRATSLYVYC